MTDSGTEKDTEKWINVSGSMARIPQNIVHHDAFDRDSAVGKLAQGRG